MPCHDITSLVGQGLLEIIHKALLFQSDEAESKSALQIDLYVRSFFFFPCVHIQFGKIRIAFELLMYQGHIHALCDWEEIPIQGGSAYYHQFVVFSFSCFQRRFIAVDDGASFGSV